MRWRCDGTLVVTSDMMGAAVSDPAIISCSLSRLSISRLFSFIRAWKADGSLTGAATEQRPNSQGSTDTPACWLRRCHDPGHWYTASTVWGRHRADRRISCDSSELCWPPRVWGCREWSRAHWMSWTAPLCKYTAWMQHSKKWHNNIY